MSERELLAKGKGRVTKGAITVGPQPGDERPHWREPAEAQRAYEQSCLELGALLAISQWSPLGTRPLPTKAVTALRKARELRKKATELRLAWDRKIEREKVEARRIAEEQ